jgi:hypothetical protein
VLQLARAADGEIVGCSSPSGSATPAPECGASTNARIANSIGDPRHDVVRVRRFRRWPGLGILGCHCSRLPPRSTTTRRRHGRFLDEALSGIDDDTRGRVLGATVDFDLDLVMTSHEMWGTYVTVPALAIYQLHRDNAEPRRAHGSHSAGTATC